MWQDAIFTIGSILFSLALLPTVFGESKPEASTSALTGSVLAVYVIPFLTLHLWFSAASTAVTAVLWFVLLVQKLRSL